ncbi:MAG: hypothetical protein ABDH23_05550 [Endomicrobiia bacterium]
MKKNKEQNKVKCNNCGKEVKVDEASIKKVYSCCSVYEVVLCKECDERQKENLSCWSCC